jgi:hypothetical protein
MMKIIHSAQAFEVNCTFKRYVLRSGHIETDFYCGVEGGEFHSNPRAVC